MTKVQQLKIDLYDTLERMALIEAEHQQLQNRKLALLKAKQAAEAEAKAVTNDAIDLREGA